jgi:class 3 adenylate cyclase
MVNMSVTDAPVRISIAILFTDIEASTRNWEEQPRAMAVTLRRHDEILRRAFADHHGHVFSTGGDGFGVAFPTARQAVAAALDAQRCLHLADLDLPLRVRMGIHAGEAESRDGDYFGPDLNRAARIMASAHGGQIVVSAVAAEQLSTRIPGVELRNLGSHRLKDILTPEPILQVVVGDLPAEFPPLRTRRTGNIPQSRPVAIGRGADVASVAAALVGQRLVAVIGPDGATATATAIALSAARAVDTRYPNGTWHLDLADLDGPDDLAPALAEVLAVELEERHPTAVTERLAPLLAGGDALVVFSGGDLGGALLDAVSELLDRIPTASALVVAGAPLDHPAAHAVELPRRCLPPDLARFRDSALIGRSDALDRLRTVVADAHASGQRRLMLVGGEEGVGKSRLVAELADEVIRADGLVLRGSWAEQGVTDFQGLREAFARHLADVEPVDLDDRFADLLATLAPLLPPGFRATGGATPDTAPADLDRFAVLDALDTWLGRLTDVQPVLLWLDDLQWADPSSLQALQHLARAPRPQPLAVVCTYQPTSVDPDGGVAAALSQLRREPGYERIDLTGLDPKESAALVEETATAPLTPRTVALLHGWSGGNPYYLRELVLLVDEAAVPGADGGAVADLGEVGAPESLRNVVHWRLARRSPRLHEVLSTAAVIGTTFDTATLATVLATVLDTDADDVDPLLDEGLALGFLDHVGLGPDHLRFAKDLVRQALYDQLGPRRRARLHQRVLDVLLADPDADPGAVVHHLGVVAGPDDLTRTVEYATTAARRATEQLAYENAARHLDDALTVLDRYPDVAAPRTELLVAAGEAHTRAGAIRVGRDRLRRAAAAAVAEGADDLLARAGLAWGGVPPASPPPDPEVVEVLGAVVDRHHGDRPERALALARRAEWLHRVEPYSQRRALVDEAVAIAERLGDPAVLGWVRYSALQALHGPDEAEAAVTTGEEIVSLSQQVDDELAFQGWRMLLSGLFAVGRMDETRQVATTVRRVGERLRQPEYLRIAVMWDATVATLEGRFDDALARAAEAHAVTLIGDHSQHDDIQLMLRIPRFGLRGASPKVRAMLEDLDNPDVHPMLAWYHAEAGDHDRARGLLGVDGLVTRIAERRWYMFWAEAVGYGSAAALVGDALRTRALRELIAPYRGHLAVLGMSAFLGAVTHHTGVLSGVLGDWDAAVADLEDAITGHRYLGARPWTALSQIELARVLEARGSPGDEARAEILTAEAVQVADELGIRAVHARAGRRLIPAG